MSLGGGVSALHGFLGDYWHRLGIVFGWGGQVVFSASDTADGVNPVIIESDPVPDGEVHVYQVVSSLHQGAGAATGFLYAVSAGPGAQAFIDGNTGLTINQVLASNVPIIIGPGGYCYTAFFGLALNEVVIFNVLGYKMGIDQNA